MKKNAGMEEELEAGEVQNNPKKKKEKVMKKKTKKTKKTATKAVAKTRASVSGKYKSIRHLLENLFARNKDLTTELALPHVKKEFPKTGFVSSPSAHFAWYKSKIVSHREFTTIDPPAWAKGRSAKIKTKK